MVCSSITSLLLLMLRETLNEQFSLVLTEWSGNSFIGDFYLENLDIFVIYVSYFMGVLE